MKPSPNKTCQCKNNLKTNWILPFQDDSSAINNSPGSD